jgi:hypothetical protein
MLSQVHASPSRQAIFKAFCKADSWVPVSQIDGGKVSKGTLRRIIRDFDSVGLLESRPTPRGMTFRLAEEARWLGLLAGDGEVFIARKDEPRSRDMPAEDRLARQVLEVLCASPGSLTLREIAVGLGAWAIEVKSKLNLLLDEGLVVQGEGRRYAANRDRFSGNVCNDIESPVSLRSANTLGMSATSPVTFRDRI